MPVSTLIAVVLAASACAPSPPPPPEPRPDAATVIARIEEGVTLTCRQIVATDHWPPPRIEGMTAELDTLSALAAELRAMDPDSIPRGVLLAEPEEAAARIEALRGGWLRVLDVERTQGASQAMAQLHGPLEDVCHQALDAFPAEP